MSQSEKVPELGAEPRAVEVQRHYTLVVAMVASDVLFRFPFVKTPTVSRGD